MIFEPYFYQQFCIDKIINQKEVGLLLDMGMGKTAIALTAINELVNDYFAAGKVLIIAPLEPAKNTWPNEIKKWDHLKGLRYRLVLGSVDERLDGLRADSDIFIINRENVAWLVERYKSAWPFDMVVIDELSSFKSSKSVRFRALRKVRKYINRIVGLTGTPSPNGLLDLWSQTYLLDGGKALGRTLTGYRDRFFLPDKRNAHVIFSWKPREGAEREIYDSLESLCVSMKSADYLRLPDRITARHNVVLSPETRKSYDQLQRDALLPFADGDIDAGTAAILRNKLIQMSGGAVYDENGGVHIFGDEKLIALDRLIEEANGRPVLVFYNYKHERDRILARYPEAVSVKDDGAIDAWNSSAITILLAHPASAGHGLNLQFGGHIIIWYGPTDNLELYLQANKRLHRPGQNETVLIHHLLAEGTFDEAVLDGVLLPKEERQNALLEALRAKIPVTR